MGRSSGLAARIDPRLNKTGRFLAAVQIIDKAGNPTLVMLGLVPSICQTIEFVDPRHKAEDDGMLRAKFVSALTGSSKRPVFVAQDLSP
jgi:hypothetical protein